MHQARSPEGEGSGSRSQGRTRKAFRVAQAIGPQAFAGTAPHSAAHAEAAPAAVHEFRHSSQVKGHHSKEGRLAHSARPSASLFRQRPTPTMTGLSAQPGSDLVSGP